VGSWRYARTAVIEPVNGNGFWRITIERFHVLSLVERSKMLGWRTVFVLILPPSLRFDCFDTIFFVKSFDTNFNPSSYLKDEKTQIYTINILYNKSNYI
jgi:hypothetical protein